MKRIAMVCAAVCFSGCSCTEIGCGSAVLLDVIGAPATAAEVEWTLPDAKSLRCSLTAPSTTCMSSREPDGTLRLSLWVEPTRTATVRLLDANGAVLLDRELTLKRSEFTPNGPECAPTCNRGEAELVIASR